MNDNKRLSNTIRDVCPCKGCTERFQACSDRCPKDARGEFGYMAWKAEIDRVKKARLEYIELKTERGYKMRWEKGNGKGD